MGEIARLLLSGVAQLFECPWGAALLGLVMVVAAVRLVLAILK